MKLSAFISAFEVLAFMAGVLHATPKIAKNAIEAGLIEAPSNYEIYKDSI